MPTIFYSDVAAPTKPAKTGVVSPIKVPFSIALAANPAANDLIHLVKIPIGATLLDYQIEVPILDTNASQTLDLSLGDTADNARYQSTNRAGRTGNFGGVSSPGGTRQLNNNAVQANAVVGIVAGTLPRAYTADDVLLFKVIANSATFQAGTIRGWVEYIFNA